MSIKALLITLSLLWYFWFYVWEKVQWLIQPLEFNEELVRSSFEESKADVIGEIERSDVLSEGEKEEAIAGVRNQSSEDFEEIYRELLGENETELKGYLIEGKVIGIISLVIDSGMMLLPTLLTYFGLVHIPSILFVVIGVMSSTMLIDALEEDDQSVDTITRVILVSTYTLIQIPYFVAILVTNIL